MARPLRIEFPGAFYHITSRGNERKDVFKNKRDREKFLSYLESASERYGARIHAYCLMGNHYHLLLETPDGNLSRIMHHINGAYTTYFNVKRQRSGHLFQGRFKALLVDADEYASQLSRYIHLNPVRAGLTEMPGNYSWSSYRSYVGLEKPPRWLSTDLVLGFFGRNNSTARNSYRSFVEDLVSREYESPLKDVFASTILGGTEFVKKIQERFLVLARKDRDVPALFELGSRKTIPEIREAIDAILGKDSPLARKAGLYICHRYSGKRLKEIGSCFGVGESAVSQASSRFERMLQTNEIMRKKMAKLHKELGLSNL